MVELSRADLFLHARHSIERHELIVPSTHHYSADVGRRRPLPRIEPEDDVVKLVVGREAAHIAPPKQSLKRRCDVARGHSEIFGSVAIERHHELGLGHTEVGVDVDQSGNRCRSRLQRIHSTHKSLEIAVLNDELNRGAKAAKRRRIDGKGKDARNPEVLRLYLADYFLRGALSLVPVVEDGSQKCGAWRAAEPDE